MSMALTSLFALSLSGVDLIGQMGQTKFGQAALLALVFVSIGCCIDIGKYLFWSQRQRSNYYGVLSLILMVFSWVASCAFLVSSEGELLQAARLDSSDYVAIQKKIRAVEEQINHYENLINRRLESSYHKQWEAGQDNVDKVAGLKFSLAALIEDLSAAGLVASHQEVATTNFFNNISQFTGMDVQLVRGIGYGLLSLLLEACTLGMISLGSTLKSELVSHHDSLDGGDLEQVVPESDGQESGIKPAVYNLTLDILRGNIPPVLRHIRAAHYGISTEAIRQVLKELHAVGLLESDKRNSYKIAKFFKGIGEPDK